MRTDKKKFSTRLMAALMAGTLAVGMMGMSVFAADGDGSSGTTPPTTESKSYIEGNGGDISIPIKKDVQTDGNTYAPDTIFEFEVNPVSVTDAPENTAVPTDGITKTEIKYTSADGLGVNGSIIKGSNLKVNQSAFTAVGIYKYTISEKNDGYEGIRYDGKSYNVYITVVNENGKTYPKYVKVVDAADETKKVKEIKFVNDYGKDEDNDSTHDVTITKVITGNQAISTETFDVKVTVTAQSKKDESYKVVYVHNGATKMDKINSGETKNYPVTNNTTIRIYGLSANDTVTAVEDDNNKGYIATHSTAKAGDWESEKTINAGAKISKDNAQATVTNTKDAKAPTGLILNYGPYILMIALASSMAAFFFFKRNRKEA